MSKTFPPGTVETIELGPGAGRPELDAVSVARVLSEVAETAAETLELQAVFDRVAASIRRVIPFDHMGVIRIVDGDLAVKHATTLDCAGEEAVCSQPLPLTSWSPRLRPRPGPIERIDDARTELDPTFPGDADILAGGVRSALWEPFRTKGVFTGGVWLSAHRPHAFSGAHQQILRPIAALLGSAVSHQRLAEEARLAAEARERAERLAATVETLTRELETRNRTRIAGVSDAWKETLLQAGRVASSDTTVLITGESGTGKEVISNLIHQGSPRSGKPFVAINCAALPEQLLESELFGHEKGAFTGALAARVGRIEQAAGGTLFLDEIAEMSPLVQAKLLRVLQEREFQRLGGTRTLKADVRILAATNRDLAAAMKRQEFREDLYYRLNVFQIHVMPLRERPEDILPLAGVFLEDLGRTMGRAAAGISRDAREWFLDYPWPGNVRELRNAIERAILLCDGGLITREHLPATPARPGMGVPPEGNGWPDHVPPGGLGLEDVERNLIEKALAQARGNKSRAARLLRLTRSQLYSRLEKHGLH